MFAAIHGGKNTPHHSNQWKEKTSFAAILADFIASSRELESRKVRWLIYDAEDKASSDHHVFLCIQFQSIKIEIVKWLRMNPQVAVINILSCLIRVSESEQQSPDEGVIVRLTFSPCWWGEEQTLRRLLNVFHQTDGKLTDRGRGWTGVGGGSLLPFCVISFSE